MRGLLIVLCALATTAAAFAGGCGLLVTGLVALAAPNNADLAALLAITAPVFAVTAAVVVANVALINALSRGRAPRRNGWFLVLAVVDLVVAVALVAGGVFGHGPVKPWQDESTLILPAMLGLKGLLTLMLPAAPPHLPPPQ